MDRKNLEKYAKLLLKIGVNLQEGQELRVSAPLEAKELVEEIVKVAYRDINSGYVHVQYTHGMLTRLAIDHASDEALYTFPDYSMKRLEEYLEKNVALLSIVAADPTLFAGADMERYGNFMKDFTKKVKFYSKRVMNNELRWNVAAMPSKTWVEAVFPELSLEEGTAKLWDYIFQATRANLEDPVAAWEGHIENLLDKRDKLMALDLVKVHYKAPGTDLHVDLPEGHKWVSGQGEAADGVVFTANIPTEEVFSMPHRTGVNGRLQSTMPLNYRSSLIDNFWMEFKDGKVVDYGAEKGKESLDQLFATDENSKYLGEIALVPDDSPISNLNTIFMNTLFDENASCHFAFGKAYPECIKGGEDMSEEELLENGANVSLSHVDFMVGSAELDIDGYTKDGKIVPIFVKGNWAI